MRHIGEKVAFGSIGGFCRQFRRLQNLFGLLAARDFLLQALDGVAQLLGALLHPIFKLRVEMANLSFGGSNRQVGPHPHQHLLGVNRFGDVIDVAAGKGGDFVAHIVEPTEKNHGNGAVIGHRFESTTHFVAIHVGHFDVEQD